MNFLFSIIPSILILGVLIIIHEYGHFLACRMTGVKVEKFSIGFGPEIFHWQGKETRYVVSLLPLGGYVKPSGESVSELEESGPRSGDYLAAPVGKRIFIVVSGVLMNYLLAFVLFTVLFMTGRPVPGTMIGTFIDGYPAKTSGLAIGDKFLKVNGEEVNTWPQLTGALEKSPAGDSEFLVERKEGDRLSQLTFRIAPKAEEVKDVFGGSFQMKRLGITPHPQANEFERFGFGEAISHAWETEAGMTVVTHKAIFFLLLGKISVKTLTGPIGIISMAGTAARMGLPYILHLAATLSVSLAVLNLLPIPALDGGHFFFLLIEAIRRKPVSLVVQERATQVGFTLLLTLMALVIYNDLVNLNVIGKIQGIFQH